MARVLWLQRRPRFDRVPVYLHATLAAFLHLPRSTDSPPRTTWIGDEIVVSPTTSYASQQAEKFKIIAISGSSIILDHAALYDHFALDGNTAAPTNPTRPARRAARAPC